MGLILNIQNTVSDSDIPSRYRFKKWVSTVLEYSLLSSSRGLSAGSTPLGIELTIRITNTSEIQQLNRQYRKKDKPTNVLSFPSEIPEDFLLNSHYLGDIVICASVVRKEAKKQGKELMAHWAHMTLHGILHLLGYDHENDRDAAVMEKMEVDLLAKLGYPNPYVPSSPHSRGRRKKAEDIRHV